MFCSVLLLVLVFSCVVVAIFPKTVKEKDEKEQLKKKEDKENKKGKAFKFQNMA